MHKSIQLALLFLLGLLDMTTGQAQIFIPLTNPSFELDQPALNRQISGWTACERPFQMDLPALIKDQIDSLPVAPAAHGVHFIGLVVRGDSTQESLAQRLAQPLKAGQQYRFSCQLSRTDSFIVQSMSAPRQDSLPPQLTRIDYTGTAKLEIWGGGGPCDFAERLASSPNIDTIGWRDYNFTLSPQYSHTYLIFRAMWADSSYYDGHVLLDRCSHLLQSNNYLVFNDSTMQARLQVDDLRQDSLAQFLNSTPAIWSQLGRFPDSTMVHLRRLRDVRWLLSYTKKESLFYYLYKTPEDKMRRLKDQFEVFGMSKLAETLDRLITLNVRRYENETTSYQDFAYYDNGEKHLRAALKDANPKALMRLYLESNFEEIIQELNQLTFPYEARLSQ